MLVVGVGMILWALSEDDVPEPPDDRDETDEAGA
jgi:hypothetical protein